ncbi:MAG TPA: NUDIX domain-containing protein [Oligoflexus sp.]|uniref:NUDIX domain-containing protein n=1 Tax=Oligoflexus sp. TaxID=1971216 RepID=UPI002D6C811B|nr:NUDIX domain-containing protein [Oligoflexus sp.]HYX37591.1 NUDIX domain-containing protein [Oligoflexus sp.]
MSQDRIHIRKVDVLSDSHYILRKTAFDYLRNDGTWQTSTRESYDRGNGATLLLYNRSRKTVILTRQFRYPAFVNGSDGFLIEACAGVLDEKDPAACARREAEEETGFHIHEVQKVFEAFMSPGAVTERLYFYIGEYEDKDRKSKGGGKPGEGEDIEVLEMTLNEAMDKISSGAIVDGKTIMLLQHLKLSGLMD